MEILRSSVREIAAHWLRSALTVFGIWLGCAALVVVSALMEGVTLSIEDGFADLGFDGIFVLTGRQPADEEERLLFQRSRGLVTSDIDAIRRRAEEVAGVSGRSERTAVVTSNGVSKLVRVVGVEPDYTWMRNREPSEGRFFDQGDLLAGSKVCVLGITLREETFGTEDAVGQEITIEGIRFTVIGVGRELGNGMFREGRFLEEMRGVTIPLPIMLRELLGNAPVQMLEIKTRDPDRLDAARAEVQRILKSEHGGIRDFRIENIAAEILQARDESSEMIGNWRTVMLAIAGVTLVVGGVGLLSVLLISLAERTYEIGLRKALGATAADVFGLFLVESLMLAAMGAVIGIGVGVAVVHVVSGFFPTELTIAPSGIAVALSAAVLVGLGFGLGPALRASRMPPVEALRAKG